jgi:hypothetical protein
VNYLQSPFNGVGGRLFLTNERLLFIPGPANAAFFGGKVFSAGLDDIADVALLDRQLMKGPDLGLVWRRTSVTTRDGQTALFVLHRPQHRIASIKREIERSQTSGGDA